jgi:arylsulfatase A-like enzyme
MLPILVRLLFAGLLVAAVAARADSRAPTVSDRPNILWITAEDIGPLLGSYGDPLAETPSLDRLADTGLRFEHAYANYPVCAPARSTLIFGVYASTLGTEHMRSWQPVPPWFRLLPQYLRMAGYYTSNNAKTDYNFRGNWDAVWDDSGPGAHYRNRPPGRPFFAVFNLNDTHESRLKPTNVAEDIERGLLPAQPRLAPRELRLPPYLPERAEIREDVARQYDLVTALDRRVGELLAELDAAELADDTIVFFFGDHGGTLARSKRFVYDTGTRVPLILRIPERFAALAPESRTGVSERLVSFVDFAPTLLALADMPAPPQMQGRAFLGERVQPAEPVVLLGRGRMDERDDLVRAVTDGDWRYVRNFQPQRPDGRHLEFPFRMQRNWGAWKEACDAGDCDAAQRAFWEPRPSEALFHTAEDPWEVQNLAADPAHAARKTKLARLLERRLVETRDLGFVPESMLSTLTAGGPPYSYGRSAEYPIAHILSVALAATAPEPPDAARRDRLEAALADVHPVLRYWGAMGCLLHPDLAREQAQALRELAADDPFSANRAAAAAALAGIGDTDAALAVLLELLKLDDDIARLEVMNRIEDLGWIDRVPRAEIRRIAADGQTYYSAHVAEYWRTQRDWMFLPW